jgi:hypothetical protein
VATLERELEQGTDGLSTDGLLAPAQIDGEEVDLGDRSARRHAIAVALPTLAAGVLAGGLFTGLIEPRAYAVICGLLGVLLAYALRNLRFAWLVLVAVAGGLFAIGLIPLLAVGGSIRFSI